MPPPCGDEFSFFLAVPAMVAATAFDLWVVRDLLTVSDVPAFAAGFVMSPAP